VQVVAKTIMQKQQEALEAKAKQRADSAKRNSSNSSSRGGGSKDGGTNGGGSRESKDGGSADAGEELLLLADEVPHVLSTQLKISWQDAADRLAMVRWRFWFVCVCGGGGGVSPDISSAPRRGKVKVEFPCTRAGGGGVGIMGSVQTMGRGCCWLKSRRMSC
jgi:hypothetical protein